MKAFKHLVFAGLLLGTPACTGWLSLTPASSASPPTLPAAVGSINAGSPAPTIASGQATNVGVAGKVVSAVRVVPESHVMTIGEAKDLLANVQYADGTFDSNVTFSTSDSRIVDVNGTNGKLSAKAEGVASIIVAALLYPSKRVLVTVTVRKGTVQEALTRVVPDAVTLGVGETRQLSATVQLTDGSISPNVTWESSNQSIVLVGPTGLVTAVGKGRATVTARASGDSTRSAACAVTVE